MREHPATATLAAEVIASIGTITDEAGPLGGAMDALAGHRVAEASVHRLISDVARHLRDRLAQG